MAARGSMDASTRGPHLTPTDFGRVRRIAHEQAGLAIPSGKEGLVRSRLARRVLESDAASFAAYLDAVEANARGDEMSRFIDLLTTNKTDFFREPAHFEFLRTQVIPRVVATGEPLRIWSAGCSSGEEAYTLAMVLQESMPAGYDARVLATDISQRALSVARLGQYSAEQLAHVSPERRLRWFTSSTDGGAVVTPALRKPVAFACLNLVAPWPMVGPFDAIFCRNVMIYFDKPTVVRLISRFHALLSREGHLCIGHSESFAAIEHTYRYVQPAVYAADVGTRPARPGGT